MKRLFNRFYYFVETLFIRGAVYQVLAVAVLLALVSTVGGVTVYGLSPQYNDLSQAIWWAFLRLSDPGYLGDDTGTIPRTISTILTVAGYVLFLGALVAIMTNRLNQFMNKLSSGLSPIFEEDHILIIGWNARIHSLIEEIGHAEQRVKRRLGRSTLPAIVILTSEFDPDLLPELKEKLDPTIADRVRVLIRAGNPLEAESLERVDFTRASSIVLVSPFEGRSSRHLSDIQLVKILLSLKAQSRDLGPGELPNVVLEIGNPANKLLAENAGWGHKTEAIASDEFISRLLSHTIRNPGLSGAYNHLLTDTFGEAIHLKSVEELEVESQTLREIVPLFERSIPIGLLRSPTTPLRQEKRLFLLDLDRELDADDEIVFVAPSLKSVRRRNDAPPDPSAASTSLEPWSFEPRGESSECHLMFVGWSHLLAPILRELASYQRETFRVTLVTELDPDACRDRLRLDFDQLDNLTVRCRRSGIDHPEAVERLHPETFDNIVLLSSELVDDPLMSDADTIMAFTQLRRHLEERVDEDEMPSFAVELNDEDNRALFRFEAYHDVIMTQEIISHLLSQVGVRRALAWVYEELFTQDGPEVGMAPVGDFFETPLESGHTFEDLQNYCLQRETIALGVRYRHPSDANDRHIHLNPARDEPLELTAEDRVVLLSE
jgi:hypothetical protein